MIFDFFEVKTLYLVFHVFGVAIGAGGAFASDAMFFKSARDGRLSPTEFGFLELGGKLVWTGLVILLISGALLFWLNPEGYATSSKFQAKMAIVAVIIANGIFLHVKLIPGFKESTREGAMAIGEYGRKNPFVLASGVVSGVSWSFAIVLGVLRGVPYAFWQILLVYAGVILCAIAVASLLKSHFFPRPSEKPKEYQ